MKCLRYNTMTQPTPPMFDWGSFLAVLTPCFMAFLGWCVWVRASFKSKKEENKTFIEQIAIAATDRTIQTLLVGVNKNYTDISKSIDTLFKLREDDRKYLETMIRDMKK